MNTNAHDLRRRLRDADPIAAEPLPLAEEMARMRRAILAAAPHAGVPRRHPRTALALAAMLTIAATMAAVSARRFAVLRLEQPPVALATSAAAPRTQVQFSTPGGTRIIWTFDPAFQLRETTR